MILHVIIIYIIYASHIGIKGPGTFFFKHPLVITRYHCHFRCSFISQSNSAKQHSRDTCRTPVGHLSAKKAKLSLEDLSGWVHLNSFNNHNNQYIYIHISIYTYINIYIYQYHWIVLDSVSLDPLSSEGSSKSRKSSRERDRAMQFQDLPSRGIRVEMRGMQVFCCQAVFIYYYYHYFIYYYHEQSLDSQHLIPSRATVFEGFQVSHGQRAHVSRVSIQLLQHRTSTQSSRRVIAGIACGNTLPMVVNSWSMYVLEKRWKKNV